MNQRSFSEQWEFKPQVVSSNGSPGTKKILIDCLDTEQDRKLSSTQAHITKFHMQSEKRIKKQMHTEICLLLFVFVEQTCGLHSFYQNQWLTNLVLKQTQCGIELSGSQRDTSHGQYHHKPKRFTSCLVLDKTEAKHF